MNDRFKFRAWEWHSRGGIMRDEWEVELSSWFNRDLPVMQSTGLKDKNGVLIFEGDILGCIDEEDTSRYEVIYRAPSYEMKYPNWDKTLPYPVIEGQKWLSEWEVILGNIHQNPELMESKNV